MRLHSLVRIMLVIAFAASVGLASASAQADEIPTTTKAIDGSSVGIQMFGWNWDSLASECTNHLGPNGYDWILTLPPQEHKTGNQWWVHYQPVSYKIDSSAGTREQFAKMVASCNAAGVKVITDAVINHMASGRGTGSAGTDYEPANFPGLYSTDDFHSGLEKNDPHYCARDISNWNEIEERTNCQFPGLPDLATEKSSVRQKIANFLNDQIRLGVHGFRIDAAKHMPPADIAAIKALLPQETYFVQEIPGPTFIAHEYLGNGDVWAWDQQQFAIDMFSNAGYAHLGKDFDAATKEYGLGNQAVTWVTNHDTDHHGGAIAYNQGKLYQMTFAWLLAEPYGKPMLYSGYTFFDDAANAPLDATGKISNAKCASGSTVRSSYPDGIFTCVQRWTGLAGMIAWRDAVGTAAKANVVAKAGVYGFSRGKVGYVLINSNERSYSARKLKTGLAAGTYCDLYSGGKSPVKVAGKSCRGIAVVIAKDGTLTAKIPAQSVIALSASNKLK